jgi:hypothetical protein
LTAVLWWNSYGSSSSWSFDWAGRDFIYWFVPLTFLVIAAILRRNIFVAATQDARAEVEVSLFSRSRARQIVDAVRTVRSDLPA